MSETQLETLKRVDLSKLEQGRVLRIITGIGEAAFQYKFTAETPNRWPIGILRETNPEGEVTAEGLLMIQGSGLWTNRSQNPCQTQERGFTSYFCDLSLGTFMVGSPPNEPANRLLFDMPGQQISSLLLDDYKITA